MARLRFLLATAFCCTRALSSYWRWRLQHLRRAGHLRAICALARGETPRLRSCTSSPGRHPAYLASPPIPAPNSRGSSFPCCMLAIDDTVRPRLKRLSLVAGTSTRDEKIMPSTSSQRDDRRAWRSRNCACREVMVCRLRRWR